MKKLLFDIRQTFGHSEFYNKIKNESAWKGFRFVAKCTLLIGVTFGIIAGIVMAVAVPFLTRTYAPAIKSIYPSELILTITDGVLSANTPGPIFITTPKGFEEKHKNIIAIVPEEKIDVGLPNTYDSLIVLASTGFVFTDDTRSQTQIVEYKNDFNGVLTNETFSSTVDMIGRVASVVLPLTAIVAGILLFIFRFIGHLLLLFVLSLAMFLGCKVFKIKLSYKEIYRMGVYAIVPLLMFEVILLPLGLTGTWLTAFVIIFIIVFTVRKWRVRTEKNI